MGLHGILWLKKITYGMSNGNLYLKVIPLVSD